MLLKVCPCGSIFQSLQDFFWDWALANAYAWCLISSWEFGLKLLAVSVHLDLETATLLNLNKHPSTGLEVSLPHASGATNFQVAKHVVRFLEIKLSLHQIDNPHTHTCPFELGPCLKETKIEWVNNKLLVRVFKSNMLRPVLLQKWDKVPILVDLDLRLPRPPTRASRTLQSRTIPVSVRQSVPSNRDVRRCLQQEGCPRGFGTLSGAPESNCSLAVCQAPNWIVRRCQARELLSSYLLTTPTSQPHSSAKRPLSDSGDCGWVCGMERAGQRKRSCCQLKLRALCCGWYAWVLLKPPGWWNWASRVLAMRANAPLLFYRFPPAPARTGPPSRLKPWKPESHSIHIPWIAHNALGLWPRVLGPC